MRRLWFALVMMLLVLIAFQGAASAQSFDLIIRNGRIVDGSGNPWYTADIGILNGKIAAIGNLSTNFSPKVVDAKGRVVAPGFIDLMGGGDTALIRDPATAESKLRQGITTLLVGEGGSVAPQGDNTMRGREEGTEITWRTFAEYFQLVKQKGIPLNVVHNVGAAQVRRVVLGDNDIAPTPEQLEQMKKLVAEAMSDGAVGMSSALIYPPGSYAKPEELIEMAKVVAQFGGIYFTHMRNESLGLLAAIDETIRVAKEAGLPVHIYHLKGAGQASWPLMTQALKKIQAARDSGIDITADIYPYIRNGIGLGSFINPRHYAKGTAAFLPTLSDPKVRAAIRTEIEKTSDWENWYQHVGKNWDNVLITSAGRDADPQVVGKSVKEVATMRKVDPWQAFFDLVQTGRISVAPQSMNEEQKYEAMRAEFVMFDCDAGPTNPATAPSAHPRAFGTFPRILAKYVRADKTISLENAVRKMSSLAANRLKLWDRGRVAPGFVADLVIFDPAKVQDLATFTKPLQQSVGIDYVFVSGQAVIDDGRLIDIRPGGILRATPNVIKP
jgi:N-acyl-D-amino-acid deacylase